MKINVNGIEYEETAFRRKPAIRTYGSPVDSWNGEYFNRPDAPEKDEEEDDDA